jgi:hypothetical protein
VSADGRPGPLDTPPAVFLATWASQEGWDDSIADIAWHIGCGVATEWGLDTADPGTRIKVFGHVARWAHAAVERALGLHPDPANIDWDRVAELTGRPNAADAQAAYKPEPPF